MIPGQRFDDKGRCTFTVWAPHRRRVELKRVAPNAEREPPERERLFEMQRGYENSDREGWMGYWQLTLPDIQPGTRYLFQLDGAVVRADPASNFEPDGVHGPSQVVDHRRVAWTDDQRSGIA